MLPNTTGGAFARLHLSILLAGFTGVLGKLITLSEGMLVWYRMGLALCVVCAFFLWRGSRTGKGLPRLPPGEALRVMGVGTLLCLHWLFFYASIKLSNVSIGVVCFALVGFFTAIVEPLWLRTPIRLRELALGGLTVVGIGLIFSFDARYRLGIAVGVVASLVDVFYIVSNKTVSPRLHALDKLLYQMLGGFVFLTLLLPLYVRVFAVEQLLPGWRDWGLLVFMALFCTVGMCVLLLQSLERISAFTVNLSFNLEPVYSIIIAMLFLGEGREVGWAFFVGLACIAFSVLLQSWLAWREQQAIRKNLALDPVPRADAGTPPAT